MKPGLTATFIFLFFLSAPLFSQDTFSIVAIDSLTGEVGSAGASCIGGSIILSDVHPGVGVIHTQSFYLAANQIYGRQLMTQGFPPQQIVDSLVANDAQGNPTQRQYGVIDLVDNGRSAAYTGVNCLDYKGQILGKTYAIQGNILLGQQVLDSMETRFLNTQGDLAGRLMAALQGAKIPGADVRCLNAGTSSISAFIRVARPGDMPNKLFLDLNVNSVPTGVEPIDSLQVLFDIWRGPTGLKPSAVVPELFTLEQNYPNPFNPETTIRYELVSAGNVVLKIFTLLGQEVATLVKETQPAGSYSVGWSALDASGHPLASGVYLYRLRAGNESVTRRMVLAK